MFGFVDLGSVVLLAVHVAMLYLILRRLEGRPAGPSPQFAATVKASRLEGMARRCARPAAMVQRLIAAHGEEAMRTFVKLLANQSEKHAFKAAFGLSVRQFERQWLHASDGATAA